VNDPDTLTFPGSEVKSLGDGRFGGYLVLFGTPEKTDLVGDFFTPETDFGPNTKSRVYYDHGLDSTLGKCDVGEVELKVDAKGVWAEGVLKTREKYSAAIKEIIGKDLPALIAGKKLGWSSATAPHLVERKKVGAAHEITAWPLGLDASLTATPCEPRTLATPLKSWTPSFAKGVHLGSKAEVGAAMSAVQHLHGRLHDATWQHMGDEKSAPAARMKRIGQAYDECKAMCMKCMKSLMGEAEGEGDEMAAKAALDLRAELVCFEADLARFR
jgi:hypothetical protein